MKTKTFYQTNIFWQLLCFIFLAVFVTCCIVGVQLIMGVIDRGIGETIADKFISIVLLILYFLVTDYSAIIVPKGDEVQNCVKI